MGGFIGIVNFKKNIKNEKNTIIKMSHTLENVGPDECGYFAEDNIILSHRRLIISDADGRKTANDI